MFDQHRRRRVNPPLCIHEQVRNAAGPVAAWTPQPDPTDPARPPIGFGHVTDQGEGLLIYPEARLVVVRTMRRVENPYDRRYAARDHLEWLDEMAESIAVEKLGRNVRGE